jgi:Cell wall-associated hydrolases (invasion-associated proteins)
MNSTSKIAVIFAVALGTFSVSIPNAEAATTLRSAAMASANTQKGARYVWGAEGGYSHGYDCSGLIYWSYRQHHKTLPRLAQSQYNHSRHVAAKDRKPGDLIFIEDRYNHVYHVGIFTGVRHGKGYMLNANYGRTTKHIVGEFPVTNYTDGSPHAVYGRY